MHLSLNSLCARKPHMPRFKIKNFTLKHMLALILLISLSNCSHLKNQNQNQSYSTQAHSATSNPEYLATMWMKFSAESEALQRQAYQLAQKRLKEILREQSQKRSHLHSQKLAIVLDIDETVLNNVDYQIQCIRENFSYPEKWNEWVLSEKATPIPGALEFLKFADKNKIEIFYVTDRKENQKTATLNNLKKYHFPQPWSDHLFVKSTLTKEERKEQISRKVKIVLHIGDQLNDLDEGFKKTSSPERRKNLISIQKNLGVEYILLPNPMYGEWMSSLTKKEKEFFEKN